MLSGLDQSLGQTHVIGVLTEAPSLQAPPLLCAPHLLLERAFSALALLTFGDGYFFVVRVCPVRCGVLAASRTSVLGGNSSIPLSYDNQKSLHVRCPLLGKRDIKSPPLRTAAVEHGFTVNSGVAATTCYGHCQLHRKTVYCTHQNDIPSLSRHVNILLIQRNIHS